MSKHQPLTLKELTHLLPRLEATMALLGGGAGGSAKASKVVGKRRRQSRANPALAESLAAELNRAKKKGLSLKELTEKSGASKVQVQYHLRQLRDRKKAKLVGKRAVARWFAV